LRFIGDTTRPRDLSPTEFRLPTTMVLSGDARDWNLLAGAKLISATPFDESATEPAMSESTDNISSRAANRAADLKQRVKRDSKQRIEKGKRAAADQIEDIADALDVAGSRLDQTQPTLA